MKVLGLIGGMSWESSVEYYRYINEEVRRKLGGSNSSKCIINSLNFSELEVLMHSGKWERITEILIDAAGTLEKAGADYILICTNTMHLMFDQIQASVSKPLIHIADAAADEIKAQTLERVGLLGTKFTMEKDFYTARLETNHKIGVVVPEEHEREEIHRIIFDELVRGEIKAESKDFYTKVIEGLAAKGAQGIVLGCTEIPLLIKQEDIDVPLFDTTKLHSLYAVKKALP